jgi:hypothetical protein
MDEAALTVLAENLDVNSVLFTWVSEWVSDTVYRSPKGVVTTEIAVRTAICQLATGGVGSWSS